MTRRRTAVLIVAMLLAAVACGSPEHPEGFDGALDCGDGAWSRAMKYDRDHEGARTPFDAMVEWSGVYRDLEYGIHVETSRTGTVVVDGAEIAFMRVIELPSETFAVVEAMGCAGFEPPP